MCEGEDSSPGGPGGAGVTRAACDHRQADESGVGERAVEDEEEAATVCSV